MRQNTDRHPCHGDGDRRIFCFMQRIDVQGGARNNRHQPGIRYRGFLLHLITIRIVRGVFLRVNPVITGLFVIVTVVKLFLKLCKAPGADAVYAGSLLPSG